MLFCFSYDHNVIFSMQDARRNALQKTQEKAAGSAVAAVAPATELEDDHGDSRRGMRSSGRDEMAS